MTLRLTPARSVATLALAGVCAATAAGCGNEVPPSAVAKVGDSTITKAEFDRWLTNAAAGQAQGGPAVAPDPPDFRQCVTGLKRQPLPEEAPGQTDAELKRQCEAQYDQLKNEVMQFLIQAEWVQQEAEEQGVRVSDAEVEKSFEDQKSQAFPREADYERFLEESGMDEEDILFRVKLDQLQTKLTQKVTEDRIEITDEDVEKFYEENEESFAVPETRDVSLVLTRTEARADEAKQELEEGESFRSVAREYSIDEASKSQGGKLTDLTRGQQDQDLERAAFSAEEDGLEGPIKTQFGFYVFEVTEVTEASQPELAEVEERIRQQLRSQREQRVLEDFIKDFRDEYKDMTDCADDFTVQECDNAPEDGGEPPPASGGAPVAPQGAPQTVPPGGVPQTVPPGGAAPQGPPPAGGAPPPAPQAPTPPPASP